MKMITKEELFELLQNDFCDYQNEEYISKDHWKATFRFDNIYFKVNYFKDHIMDEDPENIEIISPL